MKKNWLVTITAFLLLGCGPVWKGWQMDYGDPAAQFLQEDLSVLGTPFVGKKITVKGIVTKVDISNPGSARVHLEGGIECNFGKFKAMAEHYNVGDIAYIDGFLKHCRKDDIYLDPASGRDHRAAFHPVHQGEP